MAAQRQAVDAIVANVFGYHGLQINVAPGAPDWLAQSQIMSAQALNLDAEGLLHGAASCRIAELPWCSESFDLIVAHHVGDAVGPRLIPELARVMNDGGVICLLVFNPLSRLSPARWGSGLPGSLPADLNIVDGLTWETELRRSRMEILLRRNCWDQRVPPDGPPTGVRRYLGWVAPSRVLLARKRSRRATPMRLRDRGRLSAAWGKPTRA